MLRSYLTATDQFCGAGGSSIGAVAAGIELKLALNHWDLAVKTHNSNFPNANHDCTDISACNPRRYPSTDILITSPECTNHSLAKGKARKMQRQLDLFGTVTLDPAEERSRATMWDVPRFAEYHKYNIIIVENVVDARYWVMWDAWLHAMQLLGYEHQIVYFNSMFAHPTPQSRDRMYVVFWRKGNHAPDLDFQPEAHCPQCGKNVNAVQVFKKPQQRWGRYKKQYIYLCPFCHTQVEPYYYCAANCIDWSLPAQKIGERKKPLKAKTLKRIQAGLDKFGRQPILADTVHSEQTIIMPPLTVNLAYTHAQNNRCQPVTDAMPTQTTYQTMGLVVPPFVTEMYGTSTYRALNEPLSTIPGTMHHGLVVPPFMVDLRGENAPKAMTDALSTICAAGTHHGLVLPFLLSLNHSTDRHNAVNEAVPTVMPQVIPAFVQPSIVPQIEECGFRMLQPHELKAAMAFPSEYILLGNARERVKLLGNAVTPPVMHMLMRRCIDSLLN